MPERGADLENVPYHIMSTFLLEEWYNTKYDMAMSQLFMAMYKSYATA